MRYRIKQWFAVLLALMMTLTTLPVTALAESVAPTEETKVEQVQSLIDELPEAEEITAENRTDVQAQIDAIDAAMLDLTEDEAVALDTARYDAAVAALLALDAPSALEQVQALIDALPEAAEITEDTRAQVEAQLAAIDEAKLELTDGERAMLDVTRYNAAVSAILALDGQTGADAPTPIERVGDFEWTVDGSTLTLTSRTGRGELDLSGAVLPSGITSVVVNGATSIGDKCFSGWSYNHSQQDLQHVTISDGLTRIGRYAFEGCIDLTTISLPDTVTTIGDGAFDSCSALALTELPANLTTIGNDAFKSCRAISLTEIPEGVTSILLTDQPLQEVFCLADDTAE